VKSERDDLVELFDHVWHRLVSRLEGLTDAELAWRPTSDDRTTLRWRLGHLVDVLAEKRNWQWLGVSAPTPAMLITSSRSAVDAIGALTEAFMEWRSLISRPDVDLSVPIGVNAGPYGRSSRRAFVLHIADELIHHAAEVALLRDLYTS
jgi:hypothetical protein